MGNVSDRCPFMCTICHRRCAASQPQSHRFDCCGEIRAHVPSMVGKGKNRDRRWADVANPMQGGYLTGPSQTARS